MKSTLLRAALMALVLGAMVGCGGGSGGGGGGASSGGPGGSVTPAPAPTGSTTINVAALSAAQLAALQPQAVVADAKVSSPPQISFAMQDPNGNPIIGLGGKDSSGNLTYLRFAIAKLVPGTPVPGSTTTTPSKWVNYIVVAGGVAQRPSSERNGTLVDNGNGTYVYTFANDITKVKDQLAAMTFNGDTTPATGENRKADLGDLTFDPNLTHRVTVQVSGGDMAKAANAIYDFVPATGKAVTATDKNRQVVAIQNCNECHGKLALHGGSRIDTQYCVVCHTDQRRYGRANVTSNASLAFPTLVEKAVVDATTGYSSYVYSKSTSHPTGTDPTYVGDGETMGDFPRMIHKIHSGHNLVKQNYNYANVAFNQVGFSMLDNGQRMCTKCHDNTKAAQADNWKNVPSRLACGACHDGINFATGAGTTLAGATTGHVGGPQPDTRCALCHDASNIPVYHQTENATEHNPTVKAGLTNFTYDVSSAAVDATSNDVTIVFRILASTDGSTPAPVTFAAAAAGGVSNPLSGFTGGPSFLLSYAMPQDGIAAPVDFNNAGVKQAQAISVAIAKSSSFSGLLDSSSTVGSLSAADANGYYTVTLKGNGPTSCGGSATPVKCVFPVGAKLRTVALQGYFTQVSPAAARHTLSVVKTVTGDTARRKVIDPAKCGNCHEWFEGHGGNRVIGKNTVGDNAVCVMCHVPGLASSGRGISDTTVNTYASTGPKFSSGDLKMLSEWGLSTTFPVTVGSNWALGLPVTTNNFKDLIHGIHKGRERVAPFQDARDRTSTNATTGAVSGAITLLDFRRMNFPGIINNCETCHLAGTYGNVSAGALASTYESVNTAGNTTTALAKSALNLANATDKVTSPFAAACVTCHDSTTAKTHITISGGGQLMVPRSALVVGQEQCAFCHGPGKIVDISVVHNK